MVNINYLSLQYAYHSYTPCPDDSTHTDPPTTSQVYITNRIYNYDYNILFKNLGCNSIFTVALYNYYYSHLSKRFISNFNFLLNYC